MPHDSTESGAFRFKGLCIRGGRTGKPFVLVMLVVCAMAVTHPVWQYWYQKIVAPLFIIMMIMALDYAMRK